MAWLIWSWVTWAECAMAAKAEEEEKLPHVAGSSMSQEMVLWISTLANLTKGAVTTKCGVCVVQPVGTVICQTPHGTETAWLAPEGQVVVAAMSKMVLST